MLLTARQLSNSQMAVSGVILPFPRPHQNGASWSLADIPIPERNGAKQGHRTLARHGPSPVGSHGARRRMRRVGSMGKVGRCALPLGIRAAVIMCIMSHAGGRRDGPGHSMPDGSLAPSPERMASGHPAIRPLAIAPVRVTSRRDIMRHDAGSRGYPTETRMVPHRPIRHACVHACMAKLCLRSRHGHGRSRMRSRACHEAGGVGQRKMARRGAVSDRAGGGGARARWGGTPPSGLWPSTSPCRGGCFVVVQATCRSVRSETIRH